jgi:hypothetical protein
MSAPRTIAAAFDPTRLDAIVKFVNLAASYWRSIEEAAIQDDALLAYARRKAAAYAPAFSGAAKNLLLPNQGSAQ